MVIIRMSTLSICLCHFAFRMTYFYFWLCSCSCVSSGVNGLMLSVDLINIFLCVHVSFSLLLTSNLWVYCSEIRWAPHLIGIELIRASVLIAVLLLVHAVEEGVTSLEAQFTVPWVIVEVTQEGQSIVCVLSHF